MKVSVIIPVYNAAPFLNKSILSALKQVQTGEVILIDDRSTDGSWDICLDWVKNDNRVRLFRNEGLKGAGATRNVGLKNIQCDYIAFLDADDYYLENRFKEDEILFEKMAHIYATANSIKVLTSNGLEHYLLNDVIKNNEIISFTKSNNKVDVYDFFKGSALHLNGLTIRKCILEQIGKFDESLKQAQDTDFLFRLFMAGEVMTTNINVVKAVYNVHQANTIKNITEAVFYRRKTAKKHFHFAVSRHLKFKLIWKFFIHFMEYDFLWLFKGSLYFKKLLKALMIPYFLYSISTKTDPPYDKDRTIHLF